MIVDLKKYLFIGAKEDLDEFFYRAQQRGYLEFISISGKKAMALPISVQTLMAAIKVLRKLPVKKPYQGGGDIAFALQTAEHILKLKGDIDKYQEEIRLLEAEISRVAPFGDFSMADIDYIEKEGKRKVQFFCMKTAKSHKTNFTGEVIYVGTDYDLDYFIAINKEAKSYPGMIEMRIDRTVGELRAHLQIVQESLHISQMDLKEFAGHIEFLHEALLEELNYYNLECAKKEASFPMESSVFAIEAWVPANKINSLFTIVDGMAVFCEEVAIEPLDRMPTCMENKGPNRMGEDLVKIYDIPASTDKDPSGWVLWSFILFFAMIVSDGGYGFLFLALAIFLRFKFPKIKQQGRRFLKLLVILSTGCIVWGVLTSSYFGIEVTPSSPLGKFSLLNYLSTKKAEYHFSKKDDVYEYWVKKYPALTTAQNGKEFLSNAKVVKDKKLSYEMLDEFSENFILELSLLLGVIHLSFSFLRYLGRNWSGIGWVCFMVGGYLFFPSMLNATSFVHYLGWIDKPTATIVGKQLLYAGLGAALLLALIQKRMKGLGEAAHVVQVFADVLSYLRLYALGLAGTIMASTFNSVGATVGFVAGILVIILGHSVNILLGTMSGVIHGLRLNFIEWYHYSFEGGGRLFNPLMKFKNK